MLPRNAANIREMERQRRLAGQWKMSDWKNYCHSWKRVYHTFVRFYDTHGDMLGVDDPFNIKLLEALDKLHEVNNLLDAEHRKSFPDSDYFVKRKLKTRAVNATAARNHRSNL